MKKGKEIADELKGLAPGMPSLDTPGYSVPEGYFDALPDMIMQRLKAETAAASPVQAELEEFSPLLAGMPRITPYTVPAGYFDSLDAHILAKRDQQAPAKVVSISRRVKLFKRCIAAACVAAILSVGGVYLAKQHNTGKIDRQLAALSDQEIEDYLQNHADDFDNEAIFSAVSSETELPSVIPDDISDATLEQYLDENMLKEEVPFN